MAVPPFAQRRLDTLNKTDGPSLVLVLARHLRRLGSNPCDIPKKLKPKYVLALDSGARQGEIFGLEWSDVEWGASTVTIARSVKDDNGRPYVGSTKSKQNRRVVVSREKLHALRAHRDAQRERGYGGPLIPQRAVCKAASHRGLDATSTCRTGDWRLVARRGAFQSPRSRLAWGTPGSRRRSTTTRTRSRRIEPNRHPAFRLALRPTAQPWATFSATRPK